MNEDLSLSAVIQAALELPDLRAQTLQVYEELLRLQQKVLVAETLLGTPPAAALLEANEELVLTLLGSQTDAGTAELARIGLAGLHAEANAAQQQLDSEQAAQLVEANEQLIFATLNAQSDAQSAARELQEMSRLAEIDLLTGLPNRLLLIDRFTHAIANAKRRRERLALLFLDLDQFKQINDTLGHAAGDEVLKCAALCLSSSVRDSDTVSRHGGDEFLILLAEVSQMADVMLVANKVIAALATPKRVGDQLLCLAASIGISVYPDDGDNADTLIARADAAMYRAKKQGLGGFVFYENEPEPDEAPPVATPPSLLVSLPPSDNERRRGLRRVADEELVQTTQSAQQGQASAEQGQRRQRAFLVRLAHELHHPPTPMRTAQARLARMAVDEPSLPLVHAVVERQVVHMARLLDDLLDITPRSRGELSLRRERVAIALIIEQAVKACRPAIVARQQQFSLQRLDAGLEVLGDPARLVQIFSNLLDNASKYTPNGGDIALSVVLQQLQIVVTVADTGMGIAAEALPTIFAPYIADAPAAACYGDGLGIGLTVVRELVEAHGGQVKAHSAGSGLGSQFVVSLPLLGLPPFSHGAGPL